MPIDKYKDKAAGQMLLKSSWMSTEDTVDLLEAWLELLLGRLVLGVTMSSAKSGLPEEERGHTLGSNCNALGV